MRGRYLAAVAAVAICLVCIAAPALAAQDHTLTLEATTPTVVTLGDAVHLTGKLTPGSTVGGEVIQLLDHDDHVLAQTRAVKYGKFSFDYAPTRTLWVHAAWKYHKVRSDPVQLKVRPRLALSMSNVLLFGTATVRGALTPWDAGAPVTVTVRRDGTAILTKTVKLGSSSKFSFALPISQPGTYVVHGVYAPQGGLKAVADSPGVATPLPSLSSGDTGKAVYLLERRLAQLHVRITNVNTTYDGVTGDAVMAFRKTQGLERTWTVDSSVWRALASPIVRHALVGGDGFHVEVNQTLQVLYTVSDGAITNILHVSTGKPSTPTHDGTFYVHRKVAGYSIGGLYYPSYFDGNRAVHGWTEVPEYAASHGCVRIPYWNATFMYDLMPLGTKVVVYHS
ncbi:MAG TPA: L,D-transpeptidase family protein [Actinomycetota bacterium]